MFEGQKSEKELPALAAQLRAFSSLLSLPSQAQSVIKDFRRQGIGSADEFNTARFFLSRLESLSAAPTSLSFLRFRSKSSKSSEGGQGETVCFVPLRSTNPTDSPDSRTSVGALVVINVGLCQSRKDQYLPLQPQCVRLLPRPMGLPPMAFAVSFRIRCRGRENRRQPP